MDPGKAMSGDHRLRRIGNCRPVRHSRRSTREEDLQVASGETIPVMEALTELTLGRRDLRMWVFIAEVT
jgi:hypothetical protein